MQIEMIRMALTIVHTEGSLALRKEIYSKKATIRIIEPKYTKMMLTERIKQLAHRSLCTKSI